MGLKDTYLSNIASVLVSGGGLRSQTEDRPLREEIANNIAWLDQAVISTGNTLLFDNPIARIYPDWTGVGLSGDITLSSTGAVIGARVMMKHADLQAFADPAEVLNPADIVYQDGSDNYYLFTCVSISPFRVHVQTLDAPGSGGGGGTYTSGVQESNTATFPNTNTQMGIAAPRTGNIVMDPAGSDYGNMIYMVHNDSIAPTVSGGAGVTVNELVSIAGNYIANTDNIIVGYHRAANIVDVYILPQVAFQLPTAFNLTISGSGGSTLIGSHAYSGTNPEQDSVFTWYRADDDSGTNAAPIAGATGTTTASTPQNYSVVAADDGKYVAYGIAARDDQGNLSVEVLSDWVGPQAFGSSFHPLDIAVAAGMIHFKDFTDASKVTEDGSTYAPNAAIASIEDSYTSLVADRGVASQRPLYLASSAGSGSHRAYAENAAGSSELIESDAAAHDLPANSSLTTIMGVLIKDITTTECIWGKASTNSNGQYIYRKQAADLRIYLACTGGVRLVVNHAGFFDVGDENENIVITHRWTDGGSHEVFKNKVDQSVASAFTESIVADSAENVWIGSEVGGNSWTGEIAVLMMFASALSAQDQSDCEDWVISELAIP